MNVINSHDDDVIIVNDHYLHVSVKRCSWEQIQEVQAGKYTMSPFYQFTGLLPGIEDENGDIITIRLLACDISTIHIDSDIWRLTSHKLQNDCNKREDLN